MAFLFRNHLQVLLSFNLKHYLSKTHNQKWYKHKNLQNVMFNDLTIEEKDVLDKGWKNNEKTIDLTKSTFHLTPSLHPNKNCHILQSVHMRLESLKSKLNVKAKLSCRGSNIKYLFLWPTQELQVDLMHYALCYGHDINEANSRKIQSKHLYFILFSPYKK